jgi:alcohol dehydrogenase (NADP+)
MKNFELSNGLLIPSIGLGTSKQSEKGFEAAQIALREGYRHFDCASIYDNELELGKAFRMSPEFDRKDVFITSKIW